MPVHGHMSADLAERLDSAPEPKLTRALLVRIFSFLKPYVKELAAVAAIIVASSLLGVLPALLTGRIIDEGLIAGDLAVLLRLVLLSFLLVLVSNGVSLLEAYFNARIAQGVTFDMKNQMYAHLQAMSQRFFTDKKQGEIITRMTGDVNGVRAVVTQTLSSMLKNIVTLVITVAALYRTNWVLATCGIIAVPLFLIPTKVTGNRRWKIARSIQKKHDEANQIFNETLSVSGQLLVKLFGREGLELERFEKVNRDIYKLSIKETLTGRFFFATINVFSNIGPLIIYLAGGLLMLKYSFGPAVTIGDITVVVSLLTRMHRPLDELLNINVDLTRSLALFERIFEYFDMQPEITDRTGCTQAGRLKGEVEYDNVSFGYDPASPVLNNVSFRIRPGQTFAVVGSSGAGKSTLISLLPRLYDVDSGAIRIDGRDIRELSLGSLRRNIGMVSQDTYLFNASILENLRYAKPEASMEQIVAACQKAHIHDFISSLPQGYDTLVGNRGLRLSGGEKQRVSIARVLLKDPPIIILDEATSSLDSISESYIQAAIEPLLRDRTALVVAHRLSTVISAETIAVLHQGRLAASGGHGELLESSPLYREFFDTQFKVPEKKTADNEPDKNRQSNDPSHEKEAV